MSPPILRQLHLLPVHSWSQVKIPLLVLKTFHSMAALACCPLCSSSLGSPSSHSLTTDGSRTCSSAAPAIRNKLPVSPCLLNCPSQFRPESLFFISQYFPASAVIQNPKPGGDSCEILRKLNSINEETHIGEQLTLGTGEISGHR